MLLALASPSVVLGGGVRLGVSSRAGLALMATQDELKKQVGYKAVDDYVKSGMVVGLGTGSTAAFAVERVGQLLKEGKLTDIVAIPTSVRTKEQAEELGIPLTTLGTPESRFSKIDVAIDGADAVDPQLNLIKGGGGALFREKIVEECADKFIVIVDDSKMCDGLGPSFALPVEIAPFCWEHTMRAIAELPSLKGGKPQLRLGSSANNAVDGKDPAVTDNGLHARLIRRQGAALPLDPPRTTSRRPLHRRRLFRHADRRRAKGGGRAQGLVRRLRARPLLRHDHLGHHCGQGRHQPEAVRSRSRGPRVVC